MSFRNVVALGFAALFGLAHTAAGQSLVVTRDSASDVRLAELCFGAAEKLRVNGSDKQRTSPRLQSGGRARWCRALVPVRADSR